ncbi:MAG TPA: glycosyltransferase family 2 protein [Candidatus Brocadiia bacterium]|nr:glycosyltransferase family 2 protein [Candidatus Brocadiia bacterium]
MPSDKLPSSISVFFPVYNDAGSIAKLVADVRSVLIGRFDDWEIILVNDGSQDESPRIVDALAASDPRIRVVHHSQNRGYGGALKSGFANARKELIFYTDGDGQYDPKELSLLLERIDEADMVNGYKIRRSDNIVRKTVGRTYHFANRALFGIQTRDVDCDFRLFHRRVIDAITLESDSGAICVEMMAKVRICGFNVIEVPVHHYARQYGKSQFFRPKHITRTVLRIAHLWLLLVILGGKAKVKKMAEAAGRSAGPDREDGR